MNYGFNEKKDKIVFNSVNSDSIIKIANIESDGYTIDTEDPGITVSLDFNDNASTSDLISRGYVCMGILGFKIYSNWVKTFSITSMITQVDYNTLTFTIENLTNNVRSFSKVLFRTLWVNPNVSLLKSNS